MRSLSCSFHKTPESNKSVLTINGERHYLWRAVDQDDNVLDILVQSRRNKQAAKKFFRTLLKGLTSVPRVIIRISGRATARPSVSSYLGWNIGRVTTSITTASVICLEVLYPPSESPCALLCCHMQQVTRTSIIGQRMLACS